MPAPRLAAPFHSRRCRHEPSDRSRRSRVARQRHSVGEQERGPAGAVRDPAHRPADRAAPRARHHRRAQAARRSSASSAPTSTSISPRGTLRLRHGDTLDAAACACPPACARRSCWCRRCCTASAAPGSRTRSTAARSARARSIRTSTSSSPSAPRSRSSAARRRSGAARRFVASDHWLDYASVTTSENFILCAALARGRSPLVNAACEPHVQEFCAFLGLMGAHIAGAGTLAPAGRRQRRARRRRIHLRRRLPRGRDLPRPRRDQRRRRRRAQRRVGAVPAARPHLRQVRRRARAPRRLQLGACQRRAQGQAAAHAIG